MADKFTDDDVDLIDNENDNTDESIDEDETISKDAPTRAWRDIEKMRELRELRRQLGDDFDLIDNDLL